MRRLLVVCLLLWLPLQGVWATVAAGYLLGSSPASSHAGHHQVAVDGQAAAAVAVHAEGVSHANAGSSETDEGCPLCQDADWQAVLPAELPILEGRAPRPRSDDVRDIRSFIPPVPKPPARPAAA